MQKTLVFAFLVVGFFSHLDLAWAGARGQPPRTPSRAGQYEVHDDGCCACFEALFGSRSRVGAGDDASTAQALDRVAEASRVVQVAVRPPGVPSLDCTDQISGPPLSGPPGVGPSAPALLSLVPGVSSAVVVPIPLPRILPAPTPGQADRLVDCINQKLVSIRTAHGGGSVSQALVQCNAEDLVHYLRTYGPPAVGAYMRFGAPPSGGPVIPCDFQVIESGNPPQLRLIVYPVKATYKHASAKGSSKFMDHAFDFFTGENFVVLRPTPNFVTLVTPPKKKWRAPPRPPSADATPAVSVPVAPPEGPEAVHIRSFEEERRFTVHLANLGMVFPVHISGTAQDFVWTQKAYDGNLGSSIREQSLNVADQMSVTEGLLNFLDQFHNHPQISRVHGDIKPDNIYLYRDSSGVMRAHLGDFGTAEGRFVSPGVVAPKRKSGTYQYTAPRPEGDQNWVNPHDDMWALAISLLEMRKPDFKIRQLVSSHATGSERTHASDWALLLRSQHTVMAMHALFDIQQMCLNPQNKIDRIICGVLRPSPVMAAPSTVAGSSSAGPAVGSSAVSPGAPSPLTLDDALQIWRQP